MASPIRSPRKQKRAKKPNFSEVENVALLEEIGMEKTLLMSHFQNGITLKKKELTGGGGPLPEVPYEELVLAILGANTNLVDGIEGKGDS